MSASCLINNYQYIKSCSAQMEQDLPFYNPNDFELALSDINVLGEKSFIEKYSKVKHDLNWFMFEYPHLYTSTLDEYASYLLYVIITQIYHNKNFSIGYYESYFTEQIIGFIQNRKDFEQLKNLTLVKNYWEKAFSFLEYLINYMSTYKKVVSNTSVYFNTNNKYNYKIKVPFISVSKDERNVECTLILKYHKKKPSWYTVASLFKLYRYYAEHDIFVSKLHLYWLDTNSFLGKPIIESIPTTENVSEMVKRYADVNPYPYTNIFNKSNSLYYTKTPLDIILK